MKTYKLYVERCAKGTLYIIIFSEFRENKSLKYKIEKVVYERKGQEYWGEWNRRKENFIFSRTHFREIFESCAEEITDFPTMELALEHAALLMVET